MAEFTEVCRQAMRMCEAHAAENGDKIKYIQLCISKDGRITLKGGGTTETAEELEKYIMQWAADHPEPVYPTWAEWQKKTFPDYHAPINPCILASCKALECDGDCRGCANKPIPADVAAKLGVKPIERKGASEK